MKIGIAVFAKTPGYSPVKTRLEATIGKEKAEAFYKYSLEAVEEILSTVRTGARKAGKPYELEITWALAEPDGNQSPFWKGREAFWTGEGSLGKRLFRVSERLFKICDRVIFVGTDSPQMPIPIIEQACDHLVEGKENCIIGPCTDGGFYLFGTKTLLPEEIWTKVEYSKTDTLEQLLKQLESRDLSHSLLPIIGDVDVLEDMELLRGALKKEEHPLPKQRMLLSWLEGEF